MNTATRDATQHRDGFPWSNWMRASAYQADVFEKNSFTVICRGKFTPFIRNRAFEQMSLPDRLGDWKRDVRDEKFRVVNKRPFIYSRCAYLCLISLCARLDGYLNGCTANND